MVALSTVFLLDTPTAAASSASASALPLHIRNVSLTLRTATYLSDREYKNYTKEVEGIKKELKRLSDTVHDIAAKLYGREIPGDYGDQWAVTLKEINKCVTELSSRLDTKRSLVERLPDAVQSQVLKSIQALEIDRQMTYLKSKVLLEILGPYFQKAAKLYQQIAQRGISNTLYPSALDTVVSSIREFRANPPDLLPNLKSQIEGLHKDTLRFCLAAEPEEHWKRSLKELLGDPPHMLEINALDISPEHMYECGELPPRMAVPKTVCDTDSIESLARKVLGLQQQVHIRTIRLCQGTTEPLATVATLEVESVLYQRIAEKIDRTLVAKRNNIIGLPCSESMLNTLNYLRKLRMTLAETKSSISIFTQLSSKQVLKTWEMFKTIVQIHGGGNDALMQEFEGVDLSLLFTIADEIKEQIDPETIQDSFVRTLVRKTNDTFKSVFEVICQRHLTYTDHELETLSKILSQERTDMTCAKSFIQKTLLRLTFENPAFPFLLFDFDLATYAVATLPCYAALRKDESFQERIRTHNYRRGLNLEKEALDTLLNLHLCNAKLREDKNPKVAAYFYSKAQHLLHSMPAQRSERIDELYQKAAQGILQGYYGLSYPDYCKELATAYDPQKPYAFLYRQLISNLWSEHVSSTDIFGEITIESPTFTETQPVSFLAQLFALKKHMERISLSPKDLVLLHTLFKSYETEKEVFRETVGLAHMELALFRAREFITSTRSSHWRLVITNFDVFTVKASNSFTRYEGSDEHQECLALIQSSRLVVRNATEDAPLLEAIVEAMELDLALFRK